MSCLLPNNPLSYGLYCSPHPFPTIVATFQSVIGNEIKKQIFEKEGRLPNAIVCCGSGGSNALETTHAIAFVLNHPEEFHSDDIVIINFSGRGDKDIETILRYFYGFN